MKYALVVLLLLGGCVGTIDKQLKPYLGQPAKAIFASLGYPTEEQTIAGRKVYIWHVQHFSGSRGDFNEQTCRIRMFVDSADMVTNYDWEGNFSGCMNYMHNLPLPQ